jgi:hypothetical protein
MNNQCTIIVSSFDGYADMWKPFFTLFFRYWPDCPLDIYLVTNYEQYPDERVTSVQLGEDNGWSANLMQVLKIIDTDHIIYLQEDYFLNGEVDTADIQQMLTVIKQESAAYLRLIPDSRSVSYKDYTSIQRLPKEVSYLNSTQAAIWDRLALLSLLDPTESGWDFEKQGGIERARQLDKLFLCTDEWMIPYLATAIEKGRIIPPAVNLCEKEGVKLKTDREIEGWLHYLLRKNKAIRKLYRFFKRFVGKEVK